MKSWRAVSRNAEWQLVQTPSDHLVLTQLLSFQNVHSVFLSSIWQPACLSSSRRRGQVKKYIYFDLDCQSYHNFFKMNLLILPLFTHASLIPKHFFICWTGRKIYWRMQGKKQQPLTFLFLLWISIAAFPQQSSEYNFLKVPKSLEPLEC